MRRSNRIFRKEPPGGPEVLRPKNEYHMHHTRQDLFYTTGTLKQNEEETDTAAEVLHRLIRSPVWPAEEVKSVTDDPDDPWVYLASAVVLQAAQDYCEGVKHGYTDDVKECEEFFRSDYFRKLTMLDPDALMARLGDEAGLRKSYGLKARNINYDELFRK